MFKQNEWLNQNKVFIVGLLQFVLTTLYELFDGNKETSPWIIGYTAVVAILSYLANNLRGQWPTIISSLLSSVMVVGSLHDSGQTITGTLIITRLVLPFAIALLGIWVGPPKSRAYESQPAILKAKAQAQTEAPAPLAQNSVIEAAEKIEDKK